MRASRRVKAVLIAASIAGASLLGGSAPASADCVSAEVSYTFMGSSPAYLVGPKKCVRQTPYGEAVQGGVPRSGNTEIAEAGAWVWVPSPVSRTPEDPEN